MNGGITRDGGKTERRKDGRTERRKDRSACGTFASHPERRAHDRIPPLRFAQGDSAVLFPSFRPSVLPSFRYIPGSKLNTHRNATSSSPGDRSCASSGRLTHSGRSNRVTNRVSPMRCSARSPMPASPRKRMRPLEGASSSSWKPRRQVGERRQRHAREQPRLGPGHHRTLELGVERHEAPRSRPAGRCRAGRRRPGAGSACRGPRAASRASGGTDWRGARAGPRPAGRSDAAWPAGRRRWRGPRRAAPPSVQRAPSGPVCGALDRGAPVERVEIAAPARGEPVPMVGEAAAHRVAELELPAPGPGRYAGREPQLDRPDVVVIAAVEVAEVVGLGPLKRQPLGPGGPEAEMRPPRALDRQRWRRSGPRRCTRPGSGTGSARAGRPDSGAGARSRRPGRPRRRPPRCSRSASRTFCSKRPR